MKRYIQLKELRVYQISREISSRCWNIFEIMNWKQQKILGDQMIRAADSVGANIAEGYARYHYLDQVRFYLIARASLSEFGDHWLELLHERSIIGEFEFSEIKTMQRDLEVRLNNLISQTRKKAKQ